MIAGIPPDAEIITGLARKHPHLLQDVSLQKCVPFDSTLEHPLP
jgi:hypothetical protein